MQVRSLDANRPSHRHCARVCRADGGSKQSRQHGGLSLPRRTANTARRRPSRPRPGRGQRSKVKGGMKSKARVLQDARTRRLMFQGDACTTSCLAPAQTTCWPIQWRRPTPRPPHHAPNAALVGRSPLRTGASAGPRLAVIRPSSEALRLIVKLALMESCLPWHFSLLFVPCSRYSPNIKYPRPCCQRVACLQPSLSPIVSLSQNMRPCHNMHDTNRLLSLTHNSLCKSLCKSKRRPYL